MSLQQNYEMYEFGDKYAKSDKVVGESLAAVPTGALRANQGRN